MIDRYQDNGVWTYRDPIEHEFVSEMVLALIPLQSMDDFICGLQGVTLPEDRRDELLDRRSNALSAYIAGDYELAKSRAETLHMECKHTGLLTVLLIPAQQGHASAIGHKSRDDFEDKKNFIYTVQELDKTLTVKPRTLAEWLNCDKLAPYKIKYTGRDTLRNWFKEALPDALKSGRKKNHTVIP